MSSLLLGLQSSLHSGPRVDNLWLPDDQTVLDQLPDVLPGVSVGDLRGFVRVKPYLALATLEDRGS